MSDITTLLLLANQVGNRSRGIRSVSEHLHTVAREGEDIDPEWLAECCDQISGDLERMSREIAKIAKRAVS